MTEKAFGTIMGVCASIANKTEIDVLIIRILALIILCSSIGTFLIVYLILGIFIGEAN